MSEKGQHQASEIEQRKRARRRLMILMALLLMLVLVAGLWTYYLRTRKPLSAALPPAPAVAQAFKPHYLFSIYGVDRPLGIALSPDGQYIYVTESAGDRLIKVFDRDGRFVRSFSVPDTRPAERAPVYIAVDSYGRVYVTDRRRFALYVFDAEGNLLKELPPPGGADFWTPLGVNIVKDELLVTEVTRGEHRVMVFDLEGRLKMAFGKEGRENGEFWFPNAVVRDEAGNFYVSDGNNGRLQVLDPEGNFLYALRGLNLPRGLAIDTEKRLFLVDAVAHQVRVYSLASQPILSLYEFGDIGLGDGEFRYPNDIAVDVTGRLYITDRENNRIQVWSY